MILVNWDRRWQPVKFDEQTGRGRARWLRRSPSRTGGFAVKRGGVWYAVRLSEDKVVFQTGTTIFPLAAADLVWTVSASSPGRRRFRIERGGGVVLEVSYRDPSASFVAKNDPTRDELDEELDDMFLWVCEVSRSPDMRHDLAKVWSKQASP